MDYILASLQTRTTPIQQQQKTPSISAPRATSCVFSQGRHTANTHAPHSDSGPRIGRHCEPKFLPLEIKIHARTNEHTAMSPGARTYTSN